MKVHMYYYEKCLYAYTINKELAKKFELERNMKQIHKKVRKLSKKEFAEFMNEHRLEMLVSSPYETTTGTVSLVVTYREDEKIENELNIIMDTIDSIHSCRLDDSGFSDKMKKSIYEMMDLITDDKIYLDSLRIFIKTHIGTFMKNKTFEDS